MTMRIDWGSDTHVGNVRSNNEDSTLVRRDLDLAVLCDGMGGHRAGEVASQVASETFATAFGNLASPGASTNGDPPAPPGDIADSPDPRHLHEARVHAEAASRANAAVFAQAQSSIEYHGMGCTLVALHLRDGVASFATVGDSRLYLLRDGKLMQISEDHTRLRMLERMGITPDPAEIRRIRGMLTRAVGTQLDLDVDCGSGPTVEGDLWLLCSDGLTDELSDVEIHSLLRASKDSRSTAQACVRGAVEAGGRDNVSVIVARVVSGPVATGREELPGVQTLSIRSNPA